jgi:hypothetical protein
MAKLETFLIPIWDEDIIPQMLGMHLILCERFKMHCDDIRVFETKVE